MPNRTPHRSTKPGHARIRKHAAHLCSQTASVDEVLRAFGLLMIEQLSDLFSVDLVEDDGSVNRYLTLHNSESSQQAIESAREKYPLSKTSAYGYPRVIKTGKSQFIPGVTTHLRHRLLSSINADGDASLAVRSFLCVPLIAHGRILGALTLANTERTTVFVADDLLLLEELAEMLAEALDKLV